MIKIYIRNYHPQEHTGICVVRREGESIDKLIKRFKKRCMKDDLLQEIREHIFYEKPSVKKRKKWRKNQKARERERERYLKLRQKRKKRKKKKESTNYQKSLEKSSSLSPKIFDKKSKR